MCPCLVGVLLLCTVKQGACTIRLFVIQQLYIVNTNNGIYELNMFYCPQFMITRNFFHSSIAYFKYFTKYFKLINNPLIIVQKLNSLFFIFMFCWVISLTDTNGSMPYGGKR